MTQWSIVVMHPDDVITEAMRLVAAAGYRSKQDLVLCTCGHPGPVHFFKSIDHPAGCTHCENDDDRGDKCKGYTFVGTRP